MKDNRLIDAIGGIKDEYIKEAHEPNKGFSFNRNIFYKFSLGFICVCLCVTILPNMLRMGSAKHVSYDSATTTEAPMAGNGYYSMEDNGIQGMMETSSNYNAAADSKKTDLNKKIITNGDMNVETMNLDELVNNLLISVDGVGGYVQSSSIFNGTYRTYEAVLRIPADRYDEFVNGINETGNVTYYSKDSKDITDTYTDIEAKVRSLKAEEEVVLKFYEQASNIEELMSIEQRLSDIRYEIDSYESRLKNYDVLTTYSTLNITVRETKVYTETNDSFFTRLINSFTNGVTNFVDMIEDIVLFVSYNLMTFIFMAVLGFTGYKLYRKIRKH